MTNKKEPDFILKDGTEIVFDFEKITVAEWRSLLDRDQPLEEEDEILARVADIDPSKIPELKYPEYRRLIREFFKVAANPIDLDQKN